MGTRLRRRRPIRAEGYTAHKDNPYREDNLLPGQYHFILTSKPSPGVLSILARGIPECRSIPFLKHNPQPNFG